VGGGGSGAGLRVLAWPGKRSRAKSPYTWLLYHHIAELGVRVIEFRPDRVLRGGYDVLHVHWPDKALNARLLPARAAGGLAAIALLEAARRHGARVIWTAHNVEPHESRHPRLERWYWKRVLPRVDAVIHPSEAGRLALESRHPFLARRASSLIPLGHFRGMYSDSITRDEARRSFGIPPGARVVGFLGLVRPYKNVPHLIRTVRALPPEAGEVVLLVAGEPLTAGLEREVRAAAGDDPRVRLSLAHVPDDEIQRYLRATDLFVLPFREITNSSSALLALSFDLPVLVPSLGAMGELQSVAGADWVCTYEGELTPEILAAGLVWAGHRPAGRPRLDSLAWPQIAQRTIAVYQAAR
jgi:beta-1,4-mannosyltransferase